MRRGASGAETGSIVIEALVAVLIIAGMAAALFESMSAGAIGARAAIARRQALLVAQSVIAAADASGPVTPGAREGLDGMLAWRIAAARYPGADGASGAGPVERVTVTVREARPGGRPLLTLRSLRFGR